MTDDQKMKQAIWLIEVQKNRIKELEAENENLHKQVSEMISSLCKIGDTVYMYGLSLKDGHNEKNEVVRFIDAKTTCIEVTEDNIYQVCDLLYHKKAFFRKMKQKIILSKLLLKRFLLTQKLEENKLWI